MIHSVCILEDRVGQIHRKGFDATRWFESAQSNELLELARRGWVTEFQHTNVDSNGKETGDPTVIRHYLRTVYGVDILRKVRIVAQLINSAGSPSIVKSRIEIDPDQALDWLEEKRIDLLGRMLIEGDTD